MICRLCGNNKLKDMEKAMEHLIIEHNADPNEDFIVD